MDEDTTFRRTVKALAGEARSRLGEHPEPEELLAYAQGRLSLEDEERLQDHLALCRECTRMVLDVQTFPDLAPSPGDQPLSDRELAAEWALLREKGGLVPDRVPVPPPAPAAPPPREVRRVRRSRWALAASILLGVAALGLFLQMTRLRDRVDELSSPQVDLVVADLEPLDDPVRDDPGAVEPVRVPAAADRLVLFLSLADPRPFTTFPLEVLDAAAERVIWSHPGVPRREDGNFAVELPLALLPGDSYRLRLYGAAPEGARTLLAEYRLGLRR